MSGIKLPNGLTLVFVPGCFDSFDGTQEELDELVKTITEGFADGTFLDEAVPLDLDNGTWSDEEIEKLSKPLNFDDNNTNRKLN